MPAPIYFSWVPAQASKSSFFNPKLGGALKKQGFGGSQGHQQKVYSESSRGGGSDRPRGQAGLVITFPIIGKVNSIGGGIQCPASEGVWCPASKVFRISPGWATLAQNGQKALKKGVPPPAGPSAGGGGNRTFFRDSATTWSKWLVPSQDRVFLEGGGAV